MWNLQKYSSAKSHHLANLSTHHLAWRPFTENLSSSKVLLFLYTLNSYLDVNKIRLARPAGVKGLTTATGKIPLCSWSTGKPGFPSSAGTILPVHWQSSSKIVIRSKRLLTLWSPLIDALPPFGFWARQRRGLCEDVRFRRKHSYSACVRNQLQWLPQELKR